MGAIAKGFGCTVGLVFVMSSVTKFWRPAFFRRALADYYLLRRRVVLRRVLAPLVPVLELTIGLALLGGWYGLPASLIGAGLLLAFSFALYVNVRHGLSTDCGCSFTQTRTSWPPIVRNGLLVAMLVPVAIVGDATLSWADTITVLVLALVFAVILTILPAVSAEVSHQRVHVA